jgi:CRISPR/Cas system-associated exonuclease Cas4 (RecB family)
MTNQIPPSLTALLRPYISKKALESNRSYKIFHPSSWGTCIRKTAYQYYNDVSPFLHRKDSDIDQRMERIFDNGHYVHARWQKYLSEIGVIRGYWTCQYCLKTYGKEEKLGILNPKKGPIDTWPCKCNPKLLAYEELLVKSDPKYNFEGHVDAVIDVRGTPFETEYLTANMFVVDFKSIKDDSYSELQHAKHEHVIQTHIYMWLLDLQMAVVLYEDKDNQNIKEMSVPRDERIIETIKKESIWLVQTLSHSKLPNRPPGSSQTKTPCHFCEFKKICYA